MGEWTKWSGCKCDQGSCGNCKKEREKDVIKMCEHGGKCDCRRAEEEEDCSKPCRE